MEATLPRIDVVTARRIYGFVDAYDRGVRACEREYPDHKWTAVVVEFSQGDSGVVTFCARCGVRQCRVPVVESDPESVCIHPVGHSRERHHRDSASRWRETT
jgi:hypothetical protein